MAKMASKLWDNLDDLWGCSFTLEKKGALWFTVTGIFIVILALALYITLK